MIEKRINFLSSITQDQPHIEEKIRYFADCIELILQSIGTPGNEKYINSKIYFKILYKLVTCTNGNRHLYFQHHVEHYGSTVDFKLDYILERYFSVETTKATEEIVNYTAAIQGAKKKTEVTYDTSSLKEKLKRLIDLLDSSYLEKVIFELKRIILCKEGLFVHNHINGLNKLTEILIVEYYSLGTPKEGIRTFFSNVILPFKDRIKTADKILIYRMPVPVEIWNQRESISFRKYKHLVKKHLEKADLKVQFDNILYQYNQEKQYRIFLFKFHNVKFRKEVDEVLLEYNDALLGNSFYSKYAKKGTASEVKHFLRPGDNFIFCEVRILSGNLHDALQRALIKAKDILSLVNTNIQLDFNYPNKTIKAYFDVSEYVMQDEFTITMKNRHLLPIRQRDVEKMNQMITFVESNKQRFPVLEKYSESDRIFFNAFNSDIPAIFVSEIWRYFESLFDEYNLVQPTIDRIVAYYSIKAEQQINAGLVKRTLHYLNSGRMFGIFKELNINREQLWALITNLQNSLLLEPLKAVDDVVNHPLINQPFKRLSKLKSDKINATIHTHYYTILKSCNMQRNLYQHSNIIIEEIQKLWLDDLETFALTFRIFLINDIAANPGKTIDQIIPLVEKSKVRYKY